MSKQNSVWQATTGYSTSSALKCTVFLAVYCPRLNRYLRVRTCRCQQVPGEFWFSVWSDHPAKEQGYRSCRIPTFTSMWCPHGASNLLSSGNICCHRTTTGTMDGVNPVLLVANSSCCRVLVTMFLWRHQLYLWEVGLQSGWCPEFYERMLTAHRRVSSRECVYYGFTKNWYYFFVVKIKDLESLK